MLKGFKDKQEVLYVQKVEWLANDKYIKDECACTFTGNTLEELQNNIKERLEKCKAINVVYDKVYIKTITTKYEEVSA